MTLDTVVLILIWWLAIDTIAIAAMWLRKRTVR